MSTTSRSESVRTVPTRAALAQALCEAYGPQWDSIPACDTDHPAIHRFLAAVFQRLSVADFQAQIDAPQYDPADRLVVKDRDEVIAHVHLTSRILKFGGIELRATDVRQLATLPEYQDRGLAKRLLTSALSDMQIHGSLIATTNTNAPELYREQGWVCCGEHHVSHISPRDLLAHLEYSRNPTVKPGRRGARNITIRPWRQHEVEQLSDVYDEFTAHSFGPLIRRASHWHWLMSRPGSYDQAYVAVDATDLSDSGSGLDDCIEPSGRFIGYSVKRNDRLIEFVTRPGDPEAIRRLLARACHDAIENGRDVVQLDAPIDHPAHELIVAAGGRFRSAKGHREMMARLLDIGGFLDAIRPLLWERVRAAGTLPVSLRLECDNDSWVVSVNKRSVSTTSGPADLSLRTTRARLSQLLLGYVRLNDEVRDGRMEVSSPAAIPVAAALFPQLPFWRPLLDDTLDA